MPHLTAIILTHNEAAHIAACIQSLAFADQVVVFDSGSSDATLDIARDGGATVIEHPFSNYAAQRNAALEAVRGQSDWVLFVDADERVSAELAQAITRALDQAGYDGWRIPRHNYIFGKLTRATGWYPDYQTRLLRVGNAHYDPEKLVHEVVILKGALGTLSHPLIHYNYRDVAHFGEKQRRYSAYDADILYQQGVKAKFYSPLTMALRHFWWRFVTLKGYQDGLHGLFLSLLMGRYEFRKYRLLRGKIVTTGAFSKNARF
ncbi:MAG: glycosyltransferase family 2 protein [Phototrophicaceae bacterium]|jgi:glycosyltransferase involved in cell wall biosynthesis